jgi:hypothetical protein
MNKLSVKGIFELNIIISVVMRESVNKVKGCMLNKKLNILCTATTAAYIFRLIVIVTARIIYREAITL